MFPGATIAPDGSLILLIDVNRLVAGEAIERRPLMTSANAARVFAPGSEAVARGSIPEAAIDVVEDEKVVVLVDDSISVRKFVGRMLEKAGYRVKLASDGLEALEIVTQTRCDLVVTDLEMPRTNGYELLNHLRQQAETRNIPVMVVTSRAGAKHRERAMKEGAAAFLIKPVQERPMVDGKRIRVLIVDDSAFMRKVLQSIIAADPQLEVCGEARDGRDAVTQNEVLKPDVITMDINMPHMDGLQATEVIMSSNTRPILVVSSESREGAEVTLKSLELGAIDFVAKPSGGIDLDMNSVKEELCRKLKMSAKVRVVRTATRSKIQQEIASSAPRIEPASRTFEQSAQESRSNGGAAAAAPAPFRGSGKFPIVVVAASTGGPATLMKFVPDFPKDFPGAVILVQHMPGSFTAQFSQQLGEISRIRVK